MKTIKNSRVVLPLLALVAPLSVLSVSATEPSTHQSQDVITDGVFTTGIEGPAVDKDGVLYAVNFAEQGTIGRITGKGQADGFLILPDDSVGNGIRFDSQGRMMIADYVNHTIWAVNMADRSLSVYAHDEAMNQPNDIAISARDIIYASDPDWSTGTGQLWMVDTDGETTLIESDMGTTNGIEVSTDEQYLYVNESVQRRVWRYRLDASGKPVDKTLFHQFDDHGLDGMRCDNQGNLYIARYGAGSIVVLDPTGEKIEEYRLKGQHPTNLAFGGEDGKQVYVTMQKRGAIETFKSPHPGRAFNLHR
ncbi:SMP-30/gluconolactonase/LRE family protein [Lacimicrobium alkaliphilum]|uniref:Gluconolactonase n=1 Tax=Lacimicrobium alkaliphilum TaxID=1526571 RepID=A0ABQ1R6F7_9ALTE|nr:SMP-30/gluconolactonase/LRE family protein [Lacimicrobium alkaliphilum]GGD59960.1 gluconolactonase [Lacimicrobium alkaliphilum]